MIETDRLLLRRWRESDRPAFAAMNADPRVMELLPAVLDRPASDAMFDRLVTTDIFAAETKHDETFIGFVGLSKPRFSAPFMPCIEVAWRLVQPAWGHGY